MKLPKTPEQYLEDMQNLSGLSYLEPVHCLNVIRRIQEDSSQFWKDAYYDMLDKKGKVESELQQLRRRYKMLLEIESPCETCQDIPEVCAEVPGLRHCEKANRNRQEKSIEDE